MNFFFVFSFFFIFVLIFARRKTIKPVQANCLPAPPCHESSHEPCHGPRTVDGLVKMFDALTNGAFWFRFRFHFGGEPAVAASVRSPFWAAWPGLNEKPYFSWCWPQFLTCDRLRLSGCCSSANLLLSLWAASLAAAPTAAAWRGLISFLGWAAKVMHLLGPKNKTEIKTENPNAKATPKTNQIQVRFQFQIRFKMRITVGDVCG